MASAMEVRRTAELSYGSGDMAAAFCRTSHGRGRQQHGFNLQLVDLYLWASSSSATVLACGCAAPRQRRPEQRQCRGSSMMEGTSWLPGWGCRVVVLLSSSSEEARWMG